MTRLTTQQCHEAIAEAGGSVKKIADGGGLYLFIKNGRAFWTWQFRTASGWSSKGFGSFPEVTPKIAREKLGDYQAALRAGTVLIPVRTSRPTAARATGMPFAEACQGWLKWKSPDWRAGSRTKDQASAALARLPFKTLGEIDTDAVIAAFAGWTQRQANDCRLHLVGVLDWAAAHKHMTFGPDGNPARFEGHRAMLWPKPLKRKDQEHMASLPWAELPAFYKSIPDSEVGNALRFLILTGSRSKELRLAAWSEIEPDNGRGFGWSIPPEHTKKELPKFVPLVPEAMSLLGKRGAPDEPLFKGSSGKKLGENTIRDLLRTFRDDIDVHGFRSTLADWAGDQEPPYGEELRKIALGHKVGDDVWHAYNRGDRRHLRRGMMEAFAKYATQS